MLTKLANHIAKSADCKLGSYLPELAPVCTLLALSAADFDTILQATEVGEVWDIDRRIPKQLCEEGVVLESGSYAIDGCTLHAAKMFSSSRLRKKLSLYRRTHVSVEMTLVHFFYVSDYAVFGKFSGAIS